MKRRGLLIVSLLLGGLLLGGVVYLLWPVHATQTQVQIRVLERHEPVFERSEMNVDEFVQTEIKRLRGAEAAEALKRFRRDLDVPETQDSEADR